MQIVFLQFEINKKQKIREKKTKTSSFLDFQTNQKDSKTKNYKKKTPKETPQLIQLTVIKCTLSISRVKVESVRSSLCRRHTHKYTYTYRTHRPFSQRESIVNFATPALQSHTHIHNVRTISLFLFISSDCNFLPNKKYPFHTALKDEDFVSFVKNNYNY